MSGWKEKIHSIKGNIHGVHGAIAKYLELTGNPDRISVDDIETVLLLTGMLAPTTRREGLVNIISEFMVYYGFDPVPTEDGFYERLPH